MASRNYEFHCPQFVDFCSGVEGISSDEGSFGSTFPDKRSELFFKSKCRIQKPNSQIRILISTPIHKHSFVNTSCRSNTTDSEKINYRTRKILKRQSKSIESLHRLPDEKEQEFFPICRKRSISATDKPKKTTRPITPECLKRSLHSSKNKIYKTTEELELEEIARLQKQTSNRLRVNEVAMRRLKMKQTRDMQKDSYRKGTEEKKNDRNLAIGHGSFVRKMGVYTRNVCSRPPKEIANGQWPIFNSANHLNKLFHFFESGTKVDGANTSNACLISVKNEDGISLEYSEISHSRTNTESIQSMKFLHLPIKSRRCLFQENGQSPF